MRGAVHVLLCEFTISCFWHISVGKSHAFLQKTIGMMCMTLSFARDMRQHVDPTRCNVVRTNRENSACLTCLMFVGLPVLA